MSSPDPLASFPAFVREAHARWLAEKDLAALDTVVLAIVRFHQPGLARSSITNEEIPETTNLIADLGYDSLALAEIVFFVEDLYKVTISNEDLQGIRTITDLRTYVRAKVGA